MDNAKKMTFKFTLINTNRVAVSNVIRQIIPLSSGRVFVTMQRMKMKRFACNQRRGDGEKMTANCDSDYEWLKDRVNMYEYCDAHGLCMQYSHLWAPSRY